MNSKEYFFNEVIQEAIKGTSRTIQILELGCGTAKYVPAMIEKYPQLEYFGIEPIKASFDKAQQILNDIPRTKVTFQLGYDSIDGIEDASFDVVISFSVLEHVKQLGRFMDLSARYVKQGGLMVHRYDLGHALYHCPLWNRIKRKLYIRDPSITPPTNSQSFTVRTSIPTTDTIDTEICIFPFLWSRLDYHSFSSCIYNI